MANGRFLALANSLGPRPITYLHQRMLGVQAGKSCPVQFRIIGVVIYPKDYGATLRLSSLTA